MKNSSFISSFNYAVQGIISALTTERNMKFHWLACLGTIIISLFFDLTKMEFLILLFAITLVIVLELINTAIERTVDLVVTDYNPIAKYVKDVSAGAVMVASLNAVVVAYLLFYNKISNIGQIALVKIKNSPDHLALVAVIIVLILTIGGKYLMAKKNGGSYFQGGAVSGHTSIAFCAATVISLVAQKTVITTCALGLALLVAESRVETGVHRKSEAVAGAIVGISVAIFVFKLFT